jgi:pimeloyl-ACP methyl ester carboxylesterase
MPEKTLNGRKINYVKEGSGNPCFVILHGWSGSFESLRPLHNLLKQKGTSVIIDLPGFGLSSNPEPSWGVYEYGDAILEFIRSLDCKKIVLIGHSFGGALSIYLSAKNPDLVDKLVLSAPSFKRKNESDIEKHISFYDVFKKITKTPFYKRVRPHTLLIRKMYYKIFFPGSEILRFPHLESNFKKIVTQDISHLLSEVKQRTLILWGDEDSFVPLSHAYILKEGIEDSELKVFQGFDHSLPKLHPELVYKEIKNFIEKK